MSDILVGSRKNLGAQNAFLAPKRMISTGAPRAAKVLQATILPPQSAPVMQSLLIFHVLLHNLYDLPQRQPVYVHRLTPVDNGDANYTS